MDSETYIAKLAEWQVERAERISAAQAAGIDY
jgi:hypothetical protein